MAINVAQYVTDETTETAGTMLDDFVALSAASTPPEGTPATAAQLLPFVQVLADGIGRALQHIKDDADVVDVTAGSDTVTGGVD